MAESNVDRTTFRKRIFAHKAKTASAVIVTVVVVLILAIITYTSYVTRLYEKYKITGEVSRTNVSSSRVLGYGTQFITYSADGINCTDAKGNDVLSFPYEMQTPMVEISGSYVACADFNGRNVYIFNDKGQVGTIQMNVPIKRICVSGTGVVAIITDENTVTPISLYYYDGTLIASFRTSMAKFGYPVAISISDDSKLVGVSYLYLDSGTLMSRVAFYNFGDVGRNETDNLVSGFDYQGEVIPEIHFLSDHTAYALANDRLIFYEGKERPVSKSETLIHDEVHAVFYGDNRVGLVFINPTGETKYKMDVYTGSGKLENTFFFDVEYSDIFFANNRTVIYNAASALIYDSDGRVKFNGNFVDSVSLVIPTNSTNKYVLITPKSIQTIVLE